MIYCFPDKRNEMESIYIVLTSTIHLLETRFAHARASFQLKSDDKCFKKLIKRSALTFKKYSYPGKVVIFPTQKIKLKVS